MRRKDGALNIKECHKLERRGRRTLRNSRSSSSYTGSVRSSSYTGSVRSSSYTGSVRRKSKPYQTVTQFPGCAQKSTDNRKTDKHCFKNCAELVIRLTDINRVIRDCDAIATGENSSVNVKSGHMIMKTGPTKTTNLSKRPGTEAVDDSSDAHVDDNAMEKNEDDISLKDLKQRFENAKDSQQSASMFKESGPLDSPRKKGRKPKSADNSPRKPEISERKSPARKRKSVVKPEPSTCQMLQKSDIVTLPNTGTEPRHSGKMLNKTDSVNKTEGDNKNEDIKTGKGSSSPGRRKKKEQINSDGSFIDSPSKKGAKKGRSPSESPSPLRRKSPKKLPEKEAAITPEQEETEQAKSSPKRRKKSVEKKKSAKQSGQSADEVGTDIQGKINSLKDSPGKSPTGKSPRGRKKKTSDNENPASSESKARKPRSRSTSSSPKKPGQKTPAKQTTESSPNAVRVLNFDDDIKEKILESAKVNFPSDFKYQYTSGKSSTSLGLDDLISKVNTSIKETDENLKAIFGSAEENASSPETSEASECADSDKTMTEFNLSKSSQESLEEDIENKSEINDPTTSDKLDKNKSGEVEPDLQEANENIGNEKSDDSPSEEKAAEGECEENLEEINSVKVSVIIEDQRELSEKQETSGQKESGELSRKQVDDAHEDTENVETVNVFEMFGLKLKKLNKDVKKDNNKRESVSMESPDSKDINNRTENCEDKLLTEKQGKNAGSDDDDDVMIISETKVDNSIVISDDEHGQDIDRSGYAVLKETIEINKCKPKFTTVNNIVEAKPLEVLFLLEKETADKQSAFCCDALEEYIETNKESKRLSESHSSDKATEMQKLKIKDELEKAEADIDEIDGLVFVSFASESTLKAHMSLEKKLEWLNESQLRKLAHLKQMKERQQDSGSRRITDVKSLDEQKQNFRGVPMRMIKYQKLLKQELEDLLMGRLTHSPDKSLQRIPQKTADITKIKGWKNKFQNAEELQEATGINISESGKLHWKTEERLLKNLDPEDVKDIGLDLKRKRRKIVSYTTNKRKGGKGDYRTESSKDLLDYDYEIDESVVTERDVYNEDDEKPTPDKIPYHIKYLSQHKYGMRKSFVKRMKLDAEDERILKKLGTQKLNKEEEENTTAAVSNRSKRGKMLGIGKLTQSMAMAAVSALNKKLINKAKKLAKESGYVGETAQDDMEDEHTVDNNTENLDNDEENEESGTECSTERVKESKPRSRTSSRRQSLADDLTAGYGEVKVKQEPIEDKPCTEPGCRYGCICHLCKLSDSGEEKEPDNPLCDKEYCRLGCICDSIDTKTSSDTHCRKPGCMLECKCPPKQPKPDIPRDHSKKRKKGRQKRRKSTPVKEEEEEEEEGGDVEEDPSNCHHGNTDIDDWEPPSKRKRGSVNSRFANLPRRETTYRLAKNLDAVSRKAMEVYASSEMYAEQKIRRRRSDQMYEDGSLQLSDSSSKTSPENRRGFPGTSHSQSDMTGAPLLNEGVLEISDSDGETASEDPGTCSRTQPYQGPYIRPSDPNQPTTSKPGPDKPTSTNQSIVIDLVDSDKEDNSKSSNRRKSGRSSLPSTTSREPSGKRMQTLTEKMGIARNIQKPADEQGGEEKFKTQMVCLKPRNKHDDKSSEAGKQITLLEIISNVPWETQRNNVLSKISNAISRDSTLGVNSLQKFQWFGYFLEFLPRSDKPAVIPPELRSKLPSVIYSIRIKVTMSKDVEGRPVDKPTTSNDVIEINDTDEPDKKKYSLKLQKKLIDKIKFAEKLRTLIIAEEQKGVTSSKFSVSRDGIERALKKYKTQLWKAYTGSSNLTVDQLQVALQAAKSGKQPFKPGKILATNTETASTSVGGLHVNLNTMARISANQGFKVVCPKPSSCPSSTITSSNNIFMPLGAQSAVSVNIGGQPKMPIQPITEGNRGKFGAIKYVGSVTVSTANLMPVALGNVRSTAESLVPLQSSSTSVINQRGPIISTGQLIGVPQVSGMIVNSSQAFHNIAPTMPTITRDKRAVLVGNSSTGSANPAQGLPCITAINTDVTNGSHNSEINSTAELTCAVKESHGIKTSEPNSSGQSATGPVSSVAGLLPVPSMVHTESGYQNRAKSPINGTSTIRATMVERPGHDVMLIPVTGPQSGGQIIKGKMIMVKQDDCHTSGSQKSTAVPSPIVPVLSDGTKLLPVSVFPQPVMTPTISFVNPVSTGLMCKAKVDNIGLECQVPRVPSPEILNNALRVVYPGSTATGSTLPSLSVPMLAGSAEVVNANTNAVLINQTSPIIYPIKKAPTLQTSATNQCVLGEIPYSSGHFKLVTLSNHKGATLIMPVTTQGRLVTMGHTGQVSTPVATVMTSPSRQGRPISSKSLHKSQPREEQTSGGDSTLGTKVLKHAGRNSDKDLENINKVKSEKRVQEMSEKENIAKEKREHIQRDNEKSDMQLQDTTSRNSHGDSAINTSGAKVKDLQEIIDDDYDDKNEMVATDNSSNIEQVGTDRKGKRENSVTVGEISVRKKNQTTDEVDEEVSMMMTECSDPTRDSGKRKRESPDYLDEVELDIAVKNACGEAAIALDSEESDVDIMSVDPSFQSPNTSSELSQLRPGMRGYRERCRRRTHRQLFDHLAQVVFKYNSKLATYSSRIPKTLLMQEARGLVGALKDKMQGLEESVEDAKQYNRTLNTRLFQLTDSFVVSGVPEDIINNFLKSVKCATMSSMNSGHREKKRKHTASCLDTCDSLSEDSDTDLNYKSVAEEIYGGLAGSVNPQNSPITTNPSVTLNEKSQNANNTHSIQGSVPVQGFVSLPRRSELRVVNRGACMHNVDSPELRNKKTTIELIVIKDGEVFNKSDPPKQPELKMENANLGSNNQSPTQLTTQTIDSDDECEIRSSTGDGLLDHDQDFHESERWDEFNQSEEPIQTAVDQTNQLDLVT